MTQSPWLGAEAVGLERPFIVLNSACVQQLDEDELRCLLGHELGHVGSGHAVYKTMLMILTRWAANLSWLPVGAIALRAIIAAMLEWWRKAELSADRAGLLAGQDPAALRLLMKLAGGGDLSQVDTTAFLEQAAEYAGGGDLRDSLHKIRMTAWSTHPRRWRGGAAASVGRLRGVRAGVGRGLSAPAGRRLDERLGGDQGGRRLVPGGVQPVHRPAGRVAAPARRRCERRGRVGGRHRRSGPFLDGCRHRGRGPRAPRRPGRSGARAGAGPAENGEGTGSAGTPR
ncbi:M48 family metallopeptidase [Micromonospora sp. M12]